MTPVIEPRIDPTLARYREDYPILATSTYMNSNSMGAMPSGARDALTRYADAWEQQGVEAWHEWTRFVTEVGDMVAKFFGGAPGHTTLNQNVAFFQASVASCFDWSKPRNKVVIESLMFPNVIYVWDRYRDLGAQLHLVPSDDGMTVPTERMLEAIDETTAIVSISHAVYVSGALHDVKAICERAHEVGALVMLDVYQTAGVLPFDVMELGVDLVVGGSHKWLCAGPGTAFLWTRPGLEDQLKPRLTGWMGHAEPFAFEPAPIRYAQGPWHFMGGTPSIPAYYVAHAAYQNLLEVGLERIRAHNLGLCQMIIDRAQAAGLQVHSPLDAKWRTGFVAVEFSNSEQVSAQLIEERYKHDWRPGCGLRLGPHFYNTQEEVHRMMDRIVELATP
ncbi:MAG: aminotransferase class V-fold PLP-dependent enzyme [Nannocystaceae bacterium]|nr:aminotransferase class V-fold PLP-dependent enzyme [bacterium]